MGSRGGCRLETLEQRTLLANITGLIWHDINGDGQRQAAEPPMSGWEVYLDDNRNGSYDGGEQIAVSDFDGNYTFYTGPGRYLIGQIVKPGWMQNSPSAVFLPQAAAAPLMSGTIAGAIARASAVAPDASGRWVVGLNGASIQTVVARTGAAATLSQHLPNTYVLQFPAGAASEEATSQLASIAGVAFYYPLVPQGLVPRLIPDDPLFNDQWHLENYGQFGGDPSADLNVTTVWDQYQGNGVVVAVVDDGVDHTHPDLAPNYSAAHSYDFEDNDADPAPAFEDDDHGTVVAGVIGARGNNGVGVSGVAPAVTIAGLRLTTFTSDDVKSAGALSHLSNDIAIYNNSWGPVDDGETLKGPGPLTAAALQNGVLSGRNGKGSIYVWAAGNGYEDYDNVNYDGYANSRYAIAVTALDDLDRSASFAEEGAPILVSAYGEGDIQKEIATTDLLGAPGLDAGDYTRDFSGTSAAAPMVSGVVALMLQANPNLGWRDVQQILARTARRVVPNHSDWVQNGAKLWVNHQFGFGAVDAAAAVNLARTWQNLAPEIQIGSTVSVNRVVPDDNPAGVVSSISVNDLMLVENVEVIFTASHPYRGDLRVVLTSPEGTESVLAEQHFDGNDDYQQWSFTSRRHLGELSRGNWRLRVTDESGGDVGFWNNWTLNLYGTPVTTQQFARVLNDGATVSGRDFGNRGLPGVHATEARFGFEANPQQLTFAFSDDVVQTISQDDLEVKNTLTGAIVGQENLSFAYDQQTRRATWTLLTGVLNDGDYTARLYASQITNPDGRMLDGNSDGAGGDDLVLPFFHLSSDANRDRAVDHLDFDILFSNFGQSAGFDKGDFNLDGRIDFADFQRLEIDFGKTLGPAPASNVLAAKRPVKPTLAARLVRPVFSLKPVTRKKSVFSLLHANG